MRCKLQLETPSDYTYSLLWAELSRLLGEKIPAAIVGLEPGTYGCVVRHFNHLATKQPQNKNKNKTKTKQATIPSDVSKAIKKSDICFAGVVNASSSLLPLVMKFNLMDGILVIISKQLSYCAAVATELIG